jgi:hypothetical protein
MPVGQKHHQRVTVTVAIGFGYFDQLFDLLRGQVLTGPKLGIWGPARSDCAI